MGLTPTDSVDRAGAVAVPRVLAIASSGGHWIQLLRLRPAFEGCEVVYASTRSTDRNDVPGSDFELIPDASRWSKKAALRSAATITRLVVRRRPDAIVTTGALPGYFAVRAARLVKARTVWVDSAANSDELSLSGERAGRHVDLWLTQWEHLADAGGPAYHGSVFG